MQSSGDDRYHLPSVDVEAPEQNRVGREWCDQTMLSDFENRGADGEGEIEGKDVDFGDEEGDGDGRDCAYFDEVVGWGKC